MSNQNASVKSQKYTIAQLPVSMMSAELEGIYGSRVLAELNELIDYYNIYDEGMEFALATNPDYIPSTLRFKIIKGLIDKEARFLFSKPPDIVVKVPVVQGVDETKSKEYASILQKFLNDVLKRNHFNRQLIQALRDCLIAKRVVGTVNFDDKKGININFAPALEFVYETDPDDTSRITKLVLFFTTVDANDKAQQRIYRKKYTIGENGKCHIEETIFDGMGNEKETLFDKDTKFDRIPGEVILNEGLTGDLSGESEVEWLKDYESMYSRLRNSDIDALRKSMNPIKWSRDMSTESTKNLSNAAGAFWDLQTDPVSASQGKTGDVGVLETNMAYSSALNATLEGIKSMMYEQLDVPNVSPEALRGIVSSGKTLKAIYWGLIVRCDEKMLTWRPALESLARTIIEGAWLYPDAAKKYSPVPLPHVDFEIVVDNQYPLPEDEQEEKQTDLAEVSGNARSRKSYVKKWNGLTDTEADQEIIQMAKEREILEDNFMVPAEFDDPEQKDLKEESDES